jgi:hypothetical protein
MTYLCSALARRVLKDGATFWEEGYMAQAATQPTSISGKNGTSSNPTSAVPAARTVDPNREKALQILSKSIYKELRGNGYEPKQIVALATEIISLVTTDIGDGPLA